MTGRNAIRHKMQKRRFVFGFSRFLQGWSTPGAALGHQVGRLEHQVGRLERQVGCLGRQVGRLRCQVGRLGRLVGRL